MSALAWRLACAAVQGATHARLGLACEDRVRCQVIEPPDCGAVLVGVVSDGAGTAQRGAVGAELACSVFEDSVAQFYAGGGHLATLTRETVLIWVNSYQDTIRDRAQEECLAPRNFACTVVMAIVESGLAAFVQIGDGAIAVSQLAKPDEFACVFWPQDGEYVMRPTSPRTRTPVITSSSR